MMLIATHQSIPRVLIGTRMLTVGDRCYIQLEQPTMVEIRGIRKARYTQRIEILARGRDRRYHMIEPHQAWVE
jgi:hypothetical protein